MKHSPKRANRWHVLAAGVVSSGLLGWLLVGRAAAPVAAPAVLANEREPESDAPGAPARAQPRRMADSPVARAGPVTERWTRAAGEFSFSGVVLDALGGVVPGARVSASAPDHGALVESVLSDPSGAFHLRVPRGVFDITASAEAYSRAEVRVHAPLRDIRLVLAPASSIAGSVVQVEGEPITGAAVLATRSGDAAALPRRVTSGADGRFELDALAAGRYALLAEAAEWRSTTTWVSVGVGQVLDGVVLSASRATTLQGVVRVNDDPCAFGRVALTGPVVVTKSTDARGEVRFEGLWPGRYDVSIRCSAPGVLVAADEVAEPAVADDVLDVGLAPAHRTWRLEPPSASAHPTAALRVLIEGQGDALGVLVRGNDGRAIAGEREKGGFFFQGLALGDYDVYLQQLPQEQRRVTLAAAGETLEVAFDAPRAEMAISGRVVDEHGDPVPDAWVQARAGHGSHDGLALGAAALASDTGAFHVKGLLASTYSLTAQAALGEARLDGVEAGAGDVVLRVVAYGSLSGTLDDAHGEAPERATITYRRDGSEDVGALPCMNGEWTLPWAPPGRYRIHASSALGSSFSVVDLAPGGEAHVYSRLEPSAERRPASIFASEALP